MNKDLFGKALLDYWQGNYTEDLVTWTSISDKDILPIPYLFREFKDMPSIERRALELAQGKILDVGCGSGSHALWLQDQGLKVKAIDISEGAIEVTKLRGVSNAELKPLSEETEKFDTIILLMNGSGIFEELSKVKSYLLHLKTLLNTNGQILIDSSNLIYMYEDADQGVWTDIHNDYYGNLDYYLSYKGEEESPFKWLYIDYSLLKAKAKEVGLECEKIMDGPHFDYLARITNSAP